MNAFLEFLKTLLKRLNQPAEPVQEPMPSDPQNVEVPTPTPTPVISPREKLYAMAHSCLGTDVSPKDIADDEYGCMESVDNVVFRTFGHYINGTKLKVTLSTAIGYDFLKKSDDFVLVTEPLPGDIIISPTGQGNGKLSNGHTGIVGKAWIMSNDSSTGLWTANYTLESWKARYKIKGGFPVVFFRRISY